MRTRYSRYSNRREFGASYGLVTDGVAPDLPSFGPPDFDGAEAAGDLRDVVSDLYAQAEHLELAGLSAVAGPVRQLLDDLAAVAQYASSQLHAQPQLLEDARAVRLLAEESRQRMQLAQRDRDDLERTLLIVDAQREHAQAKRAVFDELIGVLTEAEHRGTLKRGTLKRWQRTADERARGRSSAADERAGS